MIQSVLEEATAASSTRGDLVTNKRQRTPVFIVGAGPYGVSIALELHHQKIPFVISGNPFSLWFNHTLKEYKLRSDLRVSEIFTRNGEFGLHEFLVRKYSEEFARELHMKRVPVEIFRTYLTDLVDRLPFEINRAKVSELIKSPDTNGYQVTLENGEMFAADQVILAAGLGSHRHFPDFLARLNPECVNHCWFSKQYEPLTDQRVMVIGRGQSAGEAIWHLQKKNEVTWVYRSDPIFFADPISLPPILFKAALEGSTIFSRIPTSIRGWLCQKFVGTSMTPDLKEAVERVESVRSDAELLGLKDAEENGKPTIYSEKLGRHFDKVLACTGYKLNMRNLSFIDDQIQNGIKTANGMPQLGHDFQTTMPGIYVAGGMTEPFHGPAQRFMLGSKNAALVIGASLARKYA